MTKRTIKKLWKISILVAILLCLVYIVQVCNLTCYAKKLTVLEQKKSTLSEEKAKLEIGLNSKEPTFEIEKLAKDYQFEKISKIRYIEASKGLAAK